MQQRQVFKNYLELSFFVQSISNEHRKASLLVDKEGLTRLEGIITSVLEGEPVENTSIVIDDKETVLLKEIIGINGLFRPDYSEC